ncbi:hypothetical protein PSA01_65240 [Pseudonocardia saturnea]|uniref:Uncharacterized protein n=1 Tax=Pseudonocardia saturnea TaxID=33909 RepID=A0ABQ0S9A2_9PSEU|nr:hypothetical protein Pdca_16160 [Pseudonocardia autotrophica]GEC29495.1 hypothetical protein PSA01_65240 [Pseudonocardia saturnea]
MVTVADNQPAKLAAMEGQFRTQAGAPLSLGGTYRDDELHYAPEIPYGLSLLVHHDPNGVVLGLEEFPEEDRPAGNVVHLSYNVMVGIGFALLALAAWLGWAWWRRRRIPDTRWFLRATGLSGWPRWSRWRPAGSPPMSGASRGSYTACCGPRMPSARPRACTSVSGPSPPST